MMTDTTGVEALYDMELHFIGSPSITLGDLDAEEVKRISSLIVGLTSPRSLEYDEGGMEGHVVNWRNVTYAEITRAVHVGVRLDR